MELSTGPNLVKPATLGSLLGALRTCSKLYFFILKKSPDTRIRVSLKKGGRGEKSGDGHFKKRNARLDFENAQLKGYVCTIRCPPPNPKSTLNFLEQVFA